MKPKMRKCGRWACKCRSVNCGFCRRCAGLIPIEQQQRLYELYDACPERHFTLAYKQARHRVELWLDACWRPEDSELKALWSAIDNGLAEEDEEPTYSAILDRLKELGLVAQDAPQ